MPNLTAGPGIAGKTCPYCQTPIKPGVAVHVCDTCAIPHHSECWQHNGGCTTFGCAGTGTAGVPHSEQQRSNASSPAYVQPQQYTPPAYQQNYVAPGASVQTVRDYLTESILVTLFCCMPLGIPAIVFAAQARSKKGVGDYQGAQKAAGTARLLVNLSLGLAIAYMVIMLLANLGSGRY